MLVDYALDVLRFEFIEAHRIGRDRMNQLALAIRKLSDSGEVPKHFNLTPLERMALKSIRDFLTLSPSILTALLQQTDGPKNWLTNPLVNDSIIAGVNVDGFGIKRTSKTKVE
jgi:hypothetical protein